jgi:hypothetical protein
MKRAVLVPASGPAHEIDIHGGDELRELQALVGGWIQAVPVDGPFSVYCNEEGKVMSPPLPPNYQATRTFGSLLAPDDIIAGDVVVLGDLDDEGETTSLSEEDVRSILGILEVE